MRFRSATAEDADFLVDMLVLAVNWQSERHVTRAQVLADPTLARYIEGWPWPGDLGVVAEHRKKRVGAAWIRFFSADRPGYGYVADETPELSIAVVTQWRGQGVGRALLVDHLPGQIRRYRGDQPQRGTGQLCPPPVPERRLQDRQIRASGRHHAQESPSPLIGPRHHRRVVTCVLYERFFAHDDRGGDVSVANRSAPEPTGTSAAASGSWAQTAPRTAQSTDRDSAELVGALVTRGEEDPVRRGRNHAEGRCGQSTLTDRTGPRCGSILTAGTRSPQLVARRPMIVFALDPGIRPVRLPGQRGLVMNADGTNPPLVLDDPTSSAIRVVAVTGQNTRPIEHLVLSNGHKSALRQSSSLPNHRHPRRGSARQDEAGHPPRTPDRDSCAASSASWAQGALLYLGVAERLDVP